MKEIKIYTDGACSGNPGVGGWGAVLIYKTSQKEISGAEKETTNNRMELTALIKAIETLKEPCIIKAFTDSKYVCDCIKNGWTQSWKNNGWVKSDKKPALYADLWEKLLDLIGNHEVEMNWVTGHAGHTENEICDKLATDAIKKLKRTQ